MEIIRCDRCDKELDKSNQGDQVERLSMDVVLRKNALQQYKPLKVDLCRECSCKFMMFMVRMDSMPLDDIVFEEGTIKKVLKAKFREIKVVPVG